MNLKLSINTSCNNLDELISHNKKSFSGFVCFHIVMNIVIDKKYRCLEGLNKFGIQAMLGWQPLCDMTPNKSYETFEIDGTHQLSTSLMCLPNGIMNCFPLKTGKALT